MFELSRCRCCDRDLSNISHGFRRDLGEPDRLEGVRVLVHEDHATATIRLRDLETGGCTTRTVAALDRSRVAGTLRTGLVTLRMKASLKQESSAGYPSR
jgi:hypothetical protein